MSEYIGDGSTMSLDEKLDRKKAGAYDQWATIADPEYAASIVNEDGKFLNDPYLTPGDVSKRLGCERNRFRKLAMETFRECLVDIVERDNDEPDSGLGKQSRAKALLSTRDLEIMKIILHYKERGASDNDIKEEISNRKKGLVKPLMDSEGKQQLPADPAFETLIRKLMVQTVTATGEAYSRMVTESIDPVKQSLDAIKDQLADAFRETAETSVENDRLKADLEAKEAELERLKKESEDRISNLEAELEEAKSKKRPWFKFW